MWSDDKAAPWLVTLMVVVLEFAIVYLVLNNSWRNDCIRRGVAEYNQTTGAWQWKAEYQIKEK